jgi:hypothetical protein
MRVWGAASLTRLTRLTELVFATCSVSMELGVNNWMGRLTLTSEVGCIIGVYCTRITAALDVQHVQGRVCTVVLYSSLASTTYSNPSP